MNLRLFVCVVNVGLIFVMCGVISVGECVVCSVKCDNVKLLLVIFCSSMVVVVMLCLMRNWFRLVLSFGVLKLSMLVLVVLWYVMMVYVYVSGKKCIVSVSVLFLVVFVISL